MSPPAAAQALLAAAAPSGDYEALSGDLHEEYVRILHLSGVKAANRWYWTQILLSIPSLLSYSKPEKAAIGRIAVVRISLAILVAMFLVLMAIDYALEKAGVGARLPTWFWLCIDYADPILFGAILAALVRTDGLRVTFFAALFLVLCFVVPALAGHPGSQLSPVAWVVLLAVVPAMCVGAGLQQIISRR